MTLKNDTAWKLIPRGMVNHKYLPQETQNFSLWAKMFQDPEKN